MVFPFECTLVLGYPSHFEGFNLCNTTILKGPIYVSTKSGHVRRDRSHGPRLAGSQARPRGRGGSQPPGWDPQMEFTMGDWQMVIVELRTPAIPEGLCIVWALVLFMCSARAGAERCDVLFIPQLVIHLLVAFLCCLFLFLFSLLLVVVVVVVGCRCRCRCCCCCCCTCNTSYCRIFVGPNNCHIGGVFAFFWHSRSKKTP